MRLWNSMSGVVLAFAIASAAGADWTFNSNGCGPGGINVNGSYRGSKWTVNYSFGSGGWFNGGPGGHHGGHTGGGGWNGWYGWGGGWYVGSWGSPYGWGYWDRYRPYGYASGPVESRSVSVDWSLLPGVNPQTGQSEPEALPTAPPTKIELARAAAAESKWDEAVRILREQLVETPGDAEVTRQLAVCLMLTKDVAAGTAMLRELYTKDPTLADRPFDIAALGADVGRLRDVIVKVSPIANKVKSPSAWLAVVVMMQAEGRKADALRAVQKAKDAGLERPVVERFIAALTPPPPAPKPAPGAKPTPGAPAAPAPATTPAPAKPKKPSGPPKPGPAEDKPAEGAAVNK